MPEFYFNSEITKILGIETPANKERRHSLFSFPSLPLRRPPPPLLVGHYHSSHTINFSIMFCWPNLNSTILRNPSGQENAGFGLTNTLLLFFMMFFYFYSGPGLKKNSAWQIFFSLDRRETDEKLNVDDENIPLGDTR